MRKFFKRVASLLGGVIVLALLLVAVYLLSAWHYNETYAVEASAVSIPTGDSAAIARGHHIATTRGCADCHGASLGGKTFIDDPMMGRLAGANLTSGDGGIGKRYTDAD